MYKNKYMNEKELEILFEYISKELQFQRKYMGIKQKDVAKDLGMSPANISNIERGKGNKTSLFWFLRLANYYGIGLNDLISNALDRYNKDNNKVRKPT